MRNKSISTNQTKNVKTNIQRLPVFICELDFFKVKCSSPGILTSSVWTPSCPNTLTRIRVDVNKDLTLEV